jgi:two-component system catabolic regulation response regulator CreB
VKIVKNVGKMTHLPRVLLVDDAPEIHALARQALVKRFDVSSAATLTEARQMLIKNPPNLIILDVSLPDGNGLDFCRELNQRVSASTPPVILLTSLADIDDKLAGFSAGAADYIVKPFHPSELALRALIRARPDAVRDATTGSGAGDASIEEGAGATHEATTLIGDLLFDLRTSNVSVVNPSNPAISTRMPLTTQEFKLLLCLARGQGKILSRDDIVARVWDHDVRVTQRTVDTHICKLRKKITASPSRYAVQAVYGAGYRFVEPGAFFDKN